MAVCVSQPKPSLAADAKRNNRALQGLSFGHNLVVLPAVADAGCLYFRFLRDLPSNMER